MRQLRFVRPTDDGTSLVVETADGNEQFCLPVDPALGAAARADLQRPPAGAPSATTVEKEIPIGPREIQMRVRSGESPQALADSNGVSLERIMRFARAVVEERLRIAAESRRARARRSTTEGQAVVFGEAVDERFTAHGIAPGDVTWDSHRRKDGEWVVVAQWPGGDSAHSAEWVFHRSSRSVTPLDDAAADLLSDRPIRPVAPPAAEPIRLAAAPPLAAGLAAFPPMPDAHTGPLPRFEEVFDQDAAPEGPRQVPPLAPSAELESAPESDAGLGFNAPPLPLGITDPSTRPAAAASGLRQASMANLGVARRDVPNEEKTARPRVPSWDDILLGVRGKQD